MYWWSSKNCHWWRIQIVWLLVACTYLDCLIPSDLLIGQSSGQFRGSLQPVRCCLDVLAQLLLLWQALCVHCLKRCYFCFNLCQGVLLGLELGHHLIQFLLCCLQPFRIRCSGSNQQRLCSHKYIPMYIRTYIRINVQHALCVCMYVCAVYNCVHVNQNEKIVWM